MSISIRLFLCVTICLLRSGVYAQVSDTSLTQLPGLFYHTGGLADLNKIATEENKGFFVIVYDEEDDDKLMNFEAMVLTDSSVVRMLNEQAVCFKVHMESVNGQNLVKQYELDNFPAILLINQKGKIVFSVKGRMDPDQFVDQVKRDLQDQRP